MILHSTFADTRLISLLLAKSIVSRNYSACESPKARPWLLRVEKGRPKPVQRNPSIRDRIINFSDPCSTFLVRSFLYSEEKFRRKLNNNNLQRRVDLFSCDFCILTGHSKCHSSENLLPLYIRKFYYRQLVINSSNFLNDIN